MHQTVIQAAASEQFLALKLCFYCEIHKIHLFCIYIVPHFDNQLFFKWKKRIRGGQINTNNDSIDTSADIGISSILTW